MKIDFEIRLEASIKYDNEAKVFVAHTPALKVYSQGVTRSQAKLGLADAVESFLIVAYKNEVLEKSLKKLDCCMGLKTIFDWIR